MKRILIMTLLLAVVQAVSATTFVIKVLNTPSITINGKELKVGDRFDENAVISWKSESQAMKVLSEDNNVYVFTPKIFSKYHVKNFKDYLTSVKTMAVRNDGENFPVSVEDHRAIFEGSFVLMDSLSFNVGWKVDDNSYFEATTNNLDNNFSFVIPCIGNELIITKENLASLSDNVDSISLIIRYVETEYNESVLITESMNLELVPECIISECIGQVQEIDLGPISIKTTEPEYSRPKLIDMPYKKYKERYKHTVNKIP